ncbi:MAG: OmpA family protein [Alphaproteobacteria bacterium]
MIRTASAKVSSLSLLALTAACSCLGSPDLDIAANSASKYANGSANGMDSNYFADTSEAMRAALGGKADRVFFDYDSAALTPAGQAALKDIADIMAAKKIGAAVVEGHADERGTREYNLALGDRRAVAVKRYLTSLGVNGSNLTTVSYGKERPAVEGSNEDAWAKNRRGVIIFK